MKNKCMRALSLMLSILIVLGYIPLANAFDGNKKETRSNTMVSVAGDNALANVLSEAFEENQTESVDFQNDDGTISTIKSLSLDDFIATVQLSAPVGAELVIAIYEESTMKMITSGSRKIAENETEVSVLLTECDLPDYYVTKAFLLDQYHNALCDDFEDREHTQWVQEFLSVQIDDFEPEQILFEENEENFAVISSAAVHLNSDKNTNIVEQNDMSKGVYRFKKADQQLKSLKAGDIFYVDLGSDYILDKVVSIAVGKDNVVTIHTDPDESALDYFEYIRIDSTKLGDSSDSRSNTARNTSVQENNDETTDDYKEGGHSEKIPFSLKYNGRGSLPSDDKKTEDENVKKFQTTGLNSNVTWSISVTGSYSVSVDYKYYYHSILPNDFLFDVTVKNTLDTTVEGSVSGTFGCEITFVEIDIPTSIPAVNLIGVVTFEFSSSAEFSTTLTGNVTQEKNYHREVCKEKNIDINEKKEVPSDPVIKISDKVEATITLKLKGSFGLRILRVLDATLFISAAVKGKCALLEIDLPLIKDKTTDTTATMDVLNQILHLSTDPKDKIKHDCHICLKVDLSLECELGAELSIRIFKRNASYQDDKNEHKLSGSVNPHITFNKPLGSWRFSFRPGLEIAKMKDKSVLCPHIQYLVLLELKDKDTGNAPSSPVTIDITYDAAKETLKPYRLGSDIPPSTTITTDDAGRATVFLPSATYSYTIDSEDYTLSGSMDGIAELKVDNTAVYEKAEIESTKQVSLTVNDPDGQPIEGAAVAFGNKSYHTGADGKTSFKAKMGTISIIVTSADGFQSKYMLAVKKDDNNFTVTLDLGHDVVVTVVDGNDQPLDGAALTCGKQGRFTDASGKAIMKLRNGEQVIGVTTTDGTQQSFTKKIVSETKTLLLKIQQTYRITGTVIDKEIGTPLSFVSVTATPKDGGETVNASTGSGGTFELRLADATYSVTFSLSGYKTQTIESEVHSNFGMGAIKLEYENNITYTFDQDGLLTISGNGRITDQTWLSGNGRFYYNNTLDRFYSFDSFQASVKSVVIQNGVTEIGRNAFSGCRKLTKVIISDSVTSIGDHAFSSCTGLTELTIPNSVISIGDDAFAWCTGLTKVTISDSVTSIGDFSFQSCSGLTELNIPNSLTSIGKEAFGCCSGLTAITIPNSVTSIGSHAFQSCSGLTNAVVPDSVATIGEAIFDGCDNLKQLKLPGDLGSIHKIIGYPKLEKLIITGHSICNDFFPDPYVEEIIIEPGVQKIGDKAFYNARKVSFVRLPFGVTEIGNYAFSNCVDITEIELPQSLVLIGESAFSNCESLTNLYIPKNVTKIGYDAFYSCKGLINVVISGDHLELGNCAFGKCSELRYLKLLEGVKSIGSSCFFLCESLETIILNEGLEEVGSKAFQNCGIKEITIPKTIKTWEGGCFFGCKALEVIYLAPELEIIGGSISNDTSNELTVYLSANTSFAYSVFGTNQVKLVITDGEIAKHSIQNEEGQVFQDVFHADSNSIIEIVIKEGVTGIGADAFSYCRNIKKISLPNSVNRLENDAFKECNNLSELTIPVSVTKIGFAFYGCKQLTDIYYEGTEEDWNKIDIDLSTRIAFRSVNIHYSNDPPVDKTSVRKNSGTQIKRAYTGVRPAGCLSESESDISLSDELFSQHNSGGAISATQETHSEPLGTIKFQRNAVRNTGTRFDAVKGEEYVLLVVKDADAKNPLSADNLLYIDQQTAKSATISFSYVPREDFSGATAIIYGPDKDSHIHRFGEWTVTKPATVRAEGEETHVCSVCGEKETRAIPQLTPETPQYTKGDVDGDNEVTSGDARLALRASVQLEKYEPGSAQFLAADVDGNGAIESSDARTILRVSVKLESF